MQKHDFFDLQLHATNELEDLLGERIVERLTLHGWPFSQVELLTMKSAIRRIYKSQRTPSLEADFYERVSSPLLPGHRLLIRDDVYTTLLFEFIDAPLLRDFKPPENKLVAHVQAVVEQIGQINVDVPVYIDIGTVARWRDFADVTLHLLDELVADERLLLAVTCSHLKDLARWIESVSVHRLIEQTARLTRGDLNTGNVFVTDDGYRVIDWQRPQIAPAQVDAVALLENKPFLFRHVAPHAIGVFYFLRLFWAVTAKANLLPHLPQLFDRWASEAVGFIRRAGEASP